MNRNSRIYVAGAETFVGAAITRHLRHEGFADVVPVYEHPDPSDPTAVDRFFARTQPEFVFLAAGRSLGIGGNQRRPAELMLDNLLVQCHLIDSAYRHGTTKVLHLVSGCAYPKHCAQPMHSDSLMTGPLEPTSEFYATAELAGLKLCQAFRRQYGVDFGSAISANPFGPEDDFDPDDAHVIGALMAKMQHACDTGERRVQIWGSGMARRDFIFVDDLAAAAVFVMRQYSDERPINLSAGGDVSIRELATIIAEVVGFDGELQFDASKPDGMPLKILDAQPLAALGWRPRLPLREALAVTYRWFCDTTAHQGEVHVR